MIGADVEIVIVTRGYGAGTRGGLPLRQGGWGGWQSYLQRLLGECDQRRKGRERRHRTDRKKEDSYREDEGSLHRLLADSRGWAATVGQIVRLCPAVVKRGTGVAATSGNAQAETGIN